MNIILHVWVKNNIVKKTSGISINSKIEIRNLESKFVMMNSLIMLDELGQKIFPLLFLQHRVIVLFHFLFFLFLFPSSLIFERNRTVKRYYRRHSLVSFLSVTHPLIPYSSTFSPFLTLFPYLHIYHMTFYCVVFRKN